MKKVHILVRSLLAVMICFLLTSSSVTAEVLELSEDTYENAVSEALQEENSTDITGNTLDGPLEREEPVEKKGQEDTTEETAEGQEETPDMMTTDIMLTDVIASTEVKELTAQAFLDATMQVCTIELANYEIPTDGHCVLAAVWSDNYGQDDLQWYTMSANERGYLYNCNIVNHKTSGNYQVHYYLQYNDGRMEFLTGTTFEVPGISCQDVYIENINAQSGTCKIIIDDVNCPAGIQQVQVPIWSRADQSDIVWYTAQKGNGNSFFVDMDIANHHYHTGNYNIHVYARDNNQIFENICCTTTTFPSPSAEVQTEETENGYLLKASDIKVPGGVKDILFAVWSDQNGQDDLRWNSSVYSASAQTANTAIALKDYKGYGKFQVHCYARNIYDEMVFLGGAAFEAEAPSMKNILVSKSDITGSFTIQLEGIFSKAGIQSVMVPVWSTADQSDIIWYTAKKEPTGGNYKLTSTIKNHQNHMGNYRAHVYVVDGMGQMTYVGGDMFTFQATADVSLEDDPEETLYPIKISNIKVPGGMWKLLVAVWSENGGQDDLVWYPASKNADSSYSSVIDIRNHKTLGKYYIDVYAQTSDGRMIFIGGNRDLQIDTSVSANVSIVEKDDEAGRFTVDLTTDSSITVTNLSVPVWCAEDQSDIVWYKAEKTGDQQYTVTVDASNHKCHFGKYKIHVYAATVNGMFLFSGGSTVDVELPEAIGALYTGNPGQRKLILQDVSENVASVMFPVWTTTNDQDDLIWYSGVKNDSGDWEVTIDVKNHKHSGTFIVHTYADGAFVRGTTFAIPYEETSTAFTDLAGKLQAAKSSQQLILVSASGTRATISMLNKNDDGKWHELLTSSGYVGEGGVGTTTEWSRTTPRGQYGFSMAFGIAPDPGTGLTYTQVDDTCYWVDDVASPYYNQFVSTSNTAKNWNSAEHLVDYPQAYKYALALDYNSDCVPGAGSAIFLHCETGRPTLGCISVPEDIMIKILQNVQPGCQIIIDSAEGLKKY